MFYMSSKEENSKINKILPKDIIKKRKQIYAKLRFLFISFNAS